MLCREQFTLNSRYLRYGFIPVLDGYHDLALLNCEELLEPVELVPVLVLLVHVEPLQHGAARVLEPQSYVFTESVFPIKRSINYI